MPFDKEEDQGQETQVDVDLDAAQAEISSELFGQGDDEEGKPAGDEGDDQSAGEGSETDGEGAVAGTEDQAPPHSETVEGENSAEVQELGAPKTWNNEELATWATIPQEIQAQIAPILERREQDFLNGITQYKQAAEVGAAYSKVVEPYAPILAAENVDPVGLFQSFAANHYLFSRGTQEQKVELAARLLEGYNIPLEPLLEHIASGMEAGGGVAHDPAYRELKAELDGLKQTLTSVGARETEATRTRIQNEIETFATAKDDKGNLVHPYFDEVAADIQNLFAAGLAKDLNEAYDKAVYANPATRQKEIDRLTAERTSSLTAEQNKRKQKIAESTGDHVKTTSKPRDGTVAKGSIDDTLQETMEAIKARG
jgi:hypothetical protein